MPRVNATANVALKDYFNTFYSAPTTNISLKTTLDTYTYPLTGPSNFNFGFYGASQYLFYLRVNAVSNGNVSITSPFSQGPSTQVGTLRQVFTAIHGGITVSASANSGYSFNGWYDAATGGNFLTATNPYTVSATGTATEYNAEWFARFTASGCNYAFLGYDSDDYSNACSQFLQLDVYLDNPDFGLATVLYNEGCLSLATSGYYSDGVVVRYWDGFSFTFSLSCDFS